MRRRVVERRTEGEHKEQEEVMWLTRVQNSSGGCNNADPVSVDSEPVELKFYLTKISAPVRMCLSSGPKDDLVKDKTLGKNWILLRNHCMYLTDLNVEK